MRGLACHPPYGERGALLPHLFTLTLRLARLTPGSLGAVCFLCHFPSGRPDRGLPGALPSGVRTFLPARRHSVTPRAAVVCPSTADCQRASWGSAPDAGSSLVGPRRPTPLPRRRARTRRCDPAHLMYQLAKPSCLRQGDGGQACFFCLLPSTAFSPTRRCPGESDTAPVSYIGCCEACRSPRRSSRCSSRVPGASPRGTPARRPP